MASKQREKVKSFNKENIIEFSHNLVRLIHKITYLLSDYENKTTIYLLRRNALSFLINMVIGLEQEHVEGYRKYLHYANKYLNKTNDLFKDNKVIVAHFDNKISDYLLGLINQSKELIKDLKNLLSYLLKKES